MPSDKAPGDQRHQDQRQPAFEAQRMRHAAAQAAATGGLARLPALEEPVEEHVPEDFQGLAQPGLAYYRVIAITPLLLS